MPEAPIDVILFIHTVHYEDVVFPAISTQKEDLPEATINAIVCVGDLGDGIFGRVPLREINPI